MRIHCSSRTTTSATLQFSVPGDADNSSVRGTIRGPYCKYSRTLPCTIPVTKGTATVVDPCYWTPNLPFRYELNLQFDSEGSSVTREFLWGIRCCIPHKSHLRMDAKGCVIRAVEPTGQIDLTELRELSSALLTHKRLDEKVYEEASERGVTIVDLAPIQDSERERLDLFPAIHLLRNDTSAMPTFVESDVLSIASYPSESPPASDTILMDEASVSANTTVEIAKPIIVERKIESASTADMRQACDTLQRDLAKHGQFAGYVVSHAS